MKLQLQVAEGHSLESLGLLDHQRKLAQRDATGGLAAPPTHAIETRVYAEDPNNNFFPCTGKILEFKPAVVEGVRYDTGVATGSEVSVFYDPMVAKVIASGASREEAQRRMVAALQDTVVLGLTTNQGFLLQLLLDPRFQQGGMDTGFIDSHLQNDARVKHAQLPPAAFAELSVVACVWDWARRNSRRVNGALKCVPAGWSNGPQRQQRTSFVCRQPGVSAVHDTLAVRYTNLSTRRTQGKAPQVCRRQANKLHKHSHIHAVCCSLWLHRVLARLSCLWSVRPPLRMPWSLHKWLVNLLTTAFHLVC